MIYSRKNEKRVTRIPKAKGLAGCGLRQALQMPGESAKGAKGAPGRLSPDHVTRPETEEVEGNRPKKSKYLGWDPGKEK